MASRRSAGILLYRRGAGGGREVLLVHPGGPFWTREDLGAWSIPKGEHGDEEDPQACALREVGEETGVALDACGLMDLGEVRQRGGKVVRAWACEGDLDITRLVSNTFTMEWPPRSGRQQEFPEVDRADWFGVDEARRRINPAQAAFLDRLDEPAR